MAEFDSADKQWSLLHLGVGSVPFGGRTEMTPGDKASLLGLYFGFWYFIISYIGNYLVKANSAIVKSYADVTEIVKGY